VSGIDYDTAGRRIQHLVLVLFRHVSEELAIQAAHALQALKSELVADKVDHRGQSLLAIYRLETPTGDLAENKSAVWVSPAAATQLDATAARDVAARLQVDPKLGRRSEVLGQAQGDVRSDGPPATDNVVDPRHRPGEFGCQPIGGQSQRFQKVLPQRFAGVDGRHYFGLCASWLPAKLQAICHGSAW